MSFLRPLVTSGTRMSKKYMKAPNFRSMHANSTSSSLNTANVTSEVSQSTTYSAPISKLSSAKKLNNNPKSC